MEKEYQYKAGVFLARMQPLHIAHLFLIEQAMNECEEVWIVLGSANKQDMLRNPFTLELRLRFLLETLSEKGYPKEDLDRIHVFELADWSYENDPNDPVTWGRYFYYNVVARTLQKTFAIYYSDDSEIIRRWFDSEVKDYVTLRLFDRSSMYEGLSATRVREAILSRDTAYLKQFCPSVVLENLDYIRDYYIKVNASPRPDFSME